MYDFFQFLEISIDGSKDGFLLLKMSVDYEVFCLTSGNTNGVGWQRVRLGGKELRCANKHHK